MTPSPPAATPRLTQLYCYLTAGCNLRCRHCYLAPAWESGAELEQPCLDVGLFADVVLQGKGLGLTAVKLTGGEPLLHPRLADIVAVAREHELRLVVETNGVLCTPQIAGLLAAEPGAFVSVSLDGVDAATHEHVRRVKGSFDAALAGVRHLVAASLRPQLIMSVLRANRAQMEPMVHLAEEVGAGSLKFNVVMPAQRGAALHESGETLSIAELVETGRWVEEELVPAAKVRVFYHQPPAFRPLGRLYGHDDHSDGCGRCGILGMMGLLADGSYALCGVGAFVPEMVFGHAARDPLAEVWEHAAVLTELREGLPQRLGGVCGRCLMKRTCLAGCIAHNYYLSGDLWAPFWYCEAAYADGLFPESRLYPADTGRSDELGASVSLAPSPPAADESERLLSLQTTIRRLT